jgi:hypothetical protein
MYEKDNPYEAPRNLSRSAATTWSWRHYALLVMGIHLAAIVASLFVAHSNMILSSRFLETSIALPLVSTTVLSPVVAIYITRAAMRDSPLTCASVIVGEIVLSVMQIFIWLPTVQ